MTAGDLFHALKHPGCETLTRGDIKRAMRLLLQMPIPSDLVDATFNACDLDKSGKVTLENFVHAMELRETDLYEQFARIDLDGSGEITLEELQKAKDDGAFNAQERELNALLEAMDRVSEGSDQEMHAQDRKIQWSEFRAMMILLPPATTIQTIVDLVRQTLDEQDQLRAHEERSESIALEQSSNQNVTVASTTSCWSPSVPDNSAYFWPAQIRPLPVSYDIWMQPHHQQQPSADGVYFVTNNAPTSVLDNESLEAIMMYRESVGTQMYMN
jgi:Ca2+-binding EF-hand superfamily protein